MMIYPPLEIPETLAAGPGPGNTDPRVLERFVKTGVADHMQQDVLRGMIEAKEMLRELWGTKNVYTYGVAGTGFSGADCVPSMILPGDTVVVFSNGTQALALIDGVRTDPLRAAASTYCLPCTGTRLEIGNPQRAFMADPEAESSVGVAGRGGGGAVPAWRVSA